MNTEEIEKIAMDKLKNKWGHLYISGYPQKPFPTNYENDLNMVKIGIHEGLSRNNEEKIFKLVSEITSLNEEIDSLKSSDKKFTIEDIKEAIELAREGNIGYHAPNSPMFYYDKTYNQIVEYFFTKNINK